MAEHKVWQALLDSVAKKQLTTQEEEAQLLAGLNYQVQNGGFSQWVCNGYGQERWELVRVLRAIGTPRAAAVERMVLEIGRQLNDRPNGGCFGDYLKNDTDRGHQKLADTCEPFDTMYYAQNKEFEEDCERYLAGLVGDKITADKLKAPCEFCSNKDNVPFLHSGEQWACPYCGKIHD